MTVTAAAVAPEARAQRSRIEPRSQCDSFYGRCLQAGDPTERLYHVTNGSPVVRLQRAETTQVSAKRTAMTAKWPRLRGETGREARLQRGADVRPTGALTNVLSQRSGRR
jgi:hypothetical protein